VTGCSHPVTTTVPVVAGFEPTVRQHDLNLDGAGDLVRTPRGASSELLPVDGGPVPADDLESRALWRGGLGHPLAELGAVTRTLQACAAGSTRAGRRRRASGGHVVVTGPQPRPPTRANPQ